MILALLLEFSPSFPCLLHFTRVILYPHGNNGMLSLGQAVCRLQDVQARNRLQHSAVSSGDFVDLIQQHAPAIAQY